MNVITKEEYDKGVAALTEFKVSRVHNEETGRAERITVGRTCKFTHVTTAEDVELYFSF